MRDGIGLLGLLLWGALTAGCGFVLVRDLVQARCAGWRSGIKLLAVVAFVLPCAAFLVRLALQVYPPPEWRLWGSAYMLLFLGLPGSVVVGVLTVADVPKPGDAMGVAAPAPPASALGGFGLVGLSLFAMKVLFDELVTC